MVMLMLTPQDISSTREKLGWSVAQMANHLGVHRTAVYHWENARCRPRYDEMEELNKLFHQVNGTVATVKAG